MSSSTHARLRQEAIAFFEAEVSASVRSELAELGAEFVPRFHRKMGEAGWIGLQWPEAYGGRAQGHVAGAILQEEAALAGAPVLASNINAIIGSTLIVHAAEELKRRVLPRLISGETVLCLGYSEPEAGSDLASLRSRAERSGDGWVINGAKTWTSLAHVADHMFCLARTNPDAPRHRGLTMFLVPMADVAVEPIWTLGDFRTNATFLDGIEVDDRDRVGPVDHGWDVVMTALDFERAGTARVGEAKRLLSQCFLAARSRGGFSAVERDRTAELWSQVLVVESLAYEVARRQEAGEPVTKMSSIAKVAGTELVQRVALAVMEMLGSDALLSRGAPGAVADGEVEVAYRNAVRYTVTAGTNEIQRNIIAQRGLGLPRSS